MTEPIGKKVSENPEVVEKAARRRFTAEYKQRIAMEADQCSQSGELGALLRREGLYSSTVRQWRRQIAMKEARSFRVWLQVRGLSNHRDVSTAL